MPAPKDVLHERVCLFYNRVAVALRPFDGNRVNLNGFSSVCGSFPSLLPYFAHSSFSVFCYLIPKTYFFSPVGLVGFDLIHVVRKRGNLAIDLDQVIPTVCFNRGLLLSEARSFKLQELASGQFLNTDSQRVIATTCHRYASRHMFQ